MAELLSGEKLRNRFKELAGTSKSIDVAVAWATSWDGLDRVLGTARRSDGGSVRILVGVGGYITSPEALEKIAHDAELRIYGTPDSELFHPKLYIFKRRGKALICWVGSANMTYAAFNRNVEVVAEIEDVNGTIGPKQFDELWNSIEAKPFAQFNFEGYKTRWAQERTKRPVFLANEVDVEIPAPKQSNIPLNVLKTGWAGFVAQLHAVPNLSNWLETLRAGYKFVRRDWKSDLTEYEKSVMFGLKSFGAFGHLPQVLLHGKNFLGQSVTATNQRLKIQETLNLAISLKSFQAPIVERIFSNLTSIKGCKASLATRLLAFARPDWFVVVNQKSFVGLTARFKHEVPEQLNAKQYSKLIEIIQRQPWWQSPKPENVDDRELWEGRVALIDALVYAEPK